MVTPHPTPRLTLGHATIATRDIEAMTTFYCDVLGFHVTNRGVPLPGMGEMVFLSQDPTAHHQVVLVATTEPATPGFMFADHLAFRTGTLDDLRAIRAKLDAANVQGVIPTSHGNAWSLYFTDPEGHGIECFVDSPFHVAQPYADLDLDLTAPDDAVAAATRAKIEGLPEFQPFDDWRASFAQRLDTSTEG